jgi:U1 small nuclear ribonucleoprotein
MAGLLVAVVEFIAAFITKRKFLMSAQGLPINLLAQFVPRPPIEYERPVRTHKPPRIEPMHPCVEKFEEGSPPPPPSFEPPKERKERIKVEKMIQHEEELKSRKSEYNPLECGTNSDPYRTLFIGRLAYETTERTLRRVFEEWGRVSDVKIVKDRDGSSRGYAFLEYEDERDLKDAYKFADGIKIDGRHILVDVERGRTVPGWYPRRLGGGRGPGRVGFDSKKQRKASKRKDVDMDRGNSHPHRDSFKRPRSPPRSHYPRGHDRRDFRDSRPSSRRSSFDHY